MCDLGLSKSPPHQNCAIRNGAGSTCTSNLLGRNIFGWLSNDAVSNVLDKNNVGIKLGESLYRPQYASFLHFSNILRLEILRPDVVFYDDVYHIQHPSYITFA